MKKRILFFVIAVMTCVMLIGCGKEEVKEEDKKETKPKEVVIEEPEQEEGNQEEEKENEEGALAEKSKIELTYPDDQYMKFEKTSIEVESLSPQLIVDELVKLGHLSTDIQVSSFEVADVNGEKVGNLNMNQAFGDYIRNMGTSGEYYSLGAICNSFIDTYKVSKIKITVAGADLATGHNTYSDYLGKFE